MSYKFSTGSVRQGDVYFEDDRDGQPTYIDFGQDTITLRPSGSQILYAQSDAIGIGTTSPTAQLHVSNNSIDDLLFVETTDDSNSASPIIKLKRNSSSPADADYLGQFKFQGENNADQNVTYAKISGKIGSVVDGQEQGIIEFANVKNGTNTITARFKSDELQLLNSTNLSVDGEIEVSQYIRHMGDSNTHINFAEDKIILKAGNKAMITMEEKDTAPHEVTINDGGNNIDFVVEDNSGNHLLMTDASTSMVGIGTSTPDATLHVHADAIHGGVVRISQTDNSGDASQLDLFKARVTSGMPSVIGSSDFIGQVRFAAYDGSDYGNFADIFVQATAQASPSSHPCKIVMRTTRQGSSSPTTAITIDDQQNLMVEGNLEVKDQITIRDQNPPSSASDNGMRGEIRYDTNYIYVCVADNTWKRVALSSW